jgi:hypothetical protein
MKGSLSVLQIEDLHPWVVKDKFLLWFVIDDDKFGIAKILLQKTAKNLFD